MSRRAAVPLVLAVALVAAPAAFAQARWTRPQHLTVSATDFGLAAGPSGQAAVAWVGPVAGGGSSISIAIRRPGHHFGAAQGITDSPGLMSRPDVAVDAAGNTLVVWSDEAAPHQVWWTECATQCGAPQLLTDSGDDAVVADAQAGFLGNGDAVAAWSQTSRSTGIGQVMTSLKPRGASGFDPPTVVGDTERGTPVLATGGDTTVLTWASAVPATRDGIAAALRHGSGAFSLVRVAEALTPMTGTLAATVDYAGAATIAWIRVSVGPKVEITRARPGAGFMPIERVGATTDDPVQAVSLTSGPPGKLAVGWIGQTSRRPRMEVAATRGNDKLRHRVIYTDPTRIPTFSNPTAAWTVNGSLATAWMVDVAGRAQLQARVLPPAGRAPLPIMLGPAAGDRSPTQLQLAGARRQAVAAWLRDDALDVSFR